jgi:hypothetical protein
MNPGYMIVQTDSTTLAVPDTWVNQINGINILFRYNFHLTDQKKFDPYLGLGAGLKMTLINLDAGNPGCSGEECSYGWPYGLNYTWPFAIEAVVGVRYHIIPHLSAYCEMGFSKTAVQVGLCTGF